MGHFIPNSLRGWWWLPGLHSGWTPLLLKPTTHSFTRAGVIHKHSLINIVISLSESLSEEPNSDIYFFVRQGQNKTSPTQCQMDYIWH